MVPLARLAARLRAPAPVLAAALASALGVALGAAPVSGEAPAKPPPPHTDEQVQPVLASYERDFASKDLGKQLAALRSLGRWRHKEVLKELRRVLLREADLELKSAAADGFQHQLSHAPEAARTLAEALKAWEKWATDVDAQDPKVKERVRYEANVLASCWGSVGALGWKEAWKDWKGYVDHAHDDVASAAIRAFGALKEYRVLPQLHEWFAIYPDGVSWSGGSVSVDTGASGNTDQKAAEAKWRAKFGNRAKKARPRVVDALLKALKDITGQEFEKPDQLERWMDENKALLKKHGV